MSIAYIISAYKYPEQLVRLVLRLNSERVSFWVHVDRKAPDSTYRAAVDGLSLLPNVHFLRRHTCRWGGFGHVAATLEGIDELVRGAVDYDYAILLTGQDYPIKPNAYLERFFERHAGRLFLDHFPLPCDAWEYSGLDRVERWHVRAFGQHFRFPGRGLPLKRRFPRGFAPFGGSSYWCLPRDSIEYIHRLTTDRRALIRFFKYVDVPDEIFFQTILLNSPFRSRVVNDDLRYIDWREPASGSPAILGTADFPCLAASPKLFARKFDPTVDTTVLDIIDQRLLNEVEWPRRQTVS